MKHLRSILFLLCTAMLSLSTAAAERITTGYHLGYCHGRMDQECLYSYDGETQISAAIRISSSDVKRLAGNSISSIRLALHSKIKVESLTVWVATSLDEPQCQNTIARKELSTDWNTIPLATPYTITADQDLYIGYTYKQSAQSYVISAPQAQAKQDEAFWLKVGDAPWAQPTDASTTLSLEALVDGDFLPQHDLQFSHLSLVSDSVQSGQDLYLTCQVRVDGLQPVHKFGVRAQSEAFDTFDLDINQTMNYGEEHTFYLRIPTNDNASVSDGQLTIQITHLDNIEDELTLDNIYTQKITVHPDVWQRTVLCEEFTSEPCGNCPRVANWLAEAHEQYPLAHRVQIAAHHVGFSDDFLTVEESRVYTGFFSGVSSNPAMMCDRNTDPLANGNVVYMPESVQEITSSWINALSRPTTVALSMHGTYNAEDSILNLHVRGERSASCPLGDAHLTVMVIEDSIAAVYQSGAGRDWIHQHAVRTISESWGTIIDWQNDKFTTDLALTLPSDIVPAHCTIVAFVSENTERTKGRYIENSLAVPMFNALAPSPLQDDDYIQILTAGTPKTSCYTLHGQYINSANKQSGLYIQNGRKTFYIK